MITKRQLEIFNLIREYEEKYNKELFILNSVLTKGYSIVEMKEDNTYKILKNINTKCTVLYNMLENDLLEIRWINGVALTTSSKKYTISPILAQ